QQLELGCNAAIGGKAAGFAAGSKYTMAVYDDRKWVVAECLANRARRPGFAQLRCDLSVRQGGTGRNLPRRRVDAPVKRRHTIHVKNDRSEIARFPPQLRDNALNGPLDVGRRGAFTGSGESSTQPRLRRVRVSFRELHATNSARPPRDAAGTDRGVK